VSGFLSQDISSDHLLKSLELILLGETVISPCWSMTLTGTKCKGEVNGGMAVSTPTTYQPANPGSDSTAMNAIGGVPGESRSETQEAAARGLSRRELLILRSLTEGASNKVIARKLVITESTVKVHMKAILRKLRLQHRTQAALWARTHLSKAYH
jgi:two-component system nitrate/nitrite response regulator NarL